MDISVDIDNKFVLNMLKVMQQRVGNLEPAFNIIGETIVSSIHRNFKAQGRPERWKPSLRAKKEQGRTLTDTGRLMASIIKRVNKSDIEIFASGDVPDAKIHNFGGVINIPARKQILSFSKKKRRFTKARKANFQMKVNMSARTVTMPKRQFAMVQREDWPAITKQLGDYIMG